MKNLFLIFGTFLLFSCNKQDIIKQNLLEDNTNRITLQGDVLAFNSYEDLFFALNTLNSKSEEERIDWEKSIGFTSMKTIYNRFNQEIDNIEAPTQSKYQYEVNSIANKYNDAVKYSKDFNLYIANCNGLSEASIINKDALVKVGNDIVYFGLDSIYTFPNQDLSTVKQIVKTENIANNKSLNIVNNSRIDTEEKFNSYIKKAVPNTYMSSVKEPGTISYLGSHSMQPGKHFTITNQAWHSSVYPQDNKRTAWARLRMFNVVTNQGVRGYVSLHTFVTKPNWLGTVRKIILDGIGEGGQCALTIAGSDPYLTFDHFINIQDPKNHLMADPSVDEIEFPVVVSNYFKMYGGGGLNLPLNNYKSNAFYNCINVINDSNNASFGGYWKYFYTDNRAPHPLSYQITTPIYVQVSSSGKGLFSGNQYTSNKIFLTNDEGSWE